MFLSSHFGPFNGEFAIIILHNILQDPTPVWFGLPDTSDSASVLLILVPISQDCCLFVFFFSRRHIHVQLFAHGEERAEQTASRGGEEKIKHV